MVVCVCMYGFRNVWMCVCVGFAVYGCFDNYLGVLVICVPVLTVFLYCFVYVYLFLIFPCVSATATE